MSDEPVLATVLVTTDAAEAQTARAALEGHGLTVFMQGEATAGVLAGLAGGVSNMTLQVPAEQREDACALLNGLDEAEFDFSETGFSAADFAPTREPEADKNVVVTPETLSLEVRALSKRAGVAVLFWPYGLPVLADCVRLRAYRDRMDDSTLRSLGRITVLVGTLSAVVLGLAVLLLFSLT